MFSIPTILTICNLAIMALRCAKQILYISNIYRVISGPAEAFSNKWGGRAPKTREIPRVLVKMLKSRVSEMLFPRFWG